ncbi:NYN domain-containing protein [Chloroflexota bacterium]
MGIWERTTDMQIAVLIDFENVGLSSIQWLFDQISDVGRIIVKRAYADWSVASNRRDQLLELGIEPIQLFRSASGGKNSSDIRLAIDAVDLLYSSPVDTFVIVSSDSDFVPLVSKLRAAGKTVFGAGERAKTPATLVKSCDRYFYIDQDDNTRRSKIVTHEKEQETEKLIMRAVKASIDEHGSVVGSKLHQTMHRLDPSFDYRSYGYPTFAKFLDASSGLRLVRPKGRGDVMIELADSASASASTAEPSGSEELWEQIDSAWSKRAAVGGKSVPGPIAAMEAARVLGVAKLSASRYKTLQGLLDASNCLTGKWSREGNTIIRR